MIARFPLEGLMLMTMACAALPPVDEQPGPEHGSAPEYRCEAAGTRALVRGQATSELGDDALRRSGARTLRWIRPGDYITMDLRGDRLNIELDRRGRVTRIYCG